jgi:MFS family permease
MTSTRAVLALAAGFLVLLIGGGARFAIGLTFKPMVDEFGWARGELGLAVGAYMLVSAIATFLAGRLADRLSPRVLLVSGMIVGGIGIGLMSLVSQPWHALLLYGVVFALGNGTASLVVIGVIVMRIYPGRAGLANALAISGMSVGQLMMIAVLASVLVQIGWRSVFVWIGIAHLALLPLLFALPGQGGAQSSTPPPPGGLSLREAARKRQFWAAARGLRDLRPR